MRPCSFSVIHFKQKILFYFPITSAHQALDCLLKTFFRLLISNPAETNLGAVSQVLDLVRDQNVDEANSGGLILPCFASTEGLGLLFSSLFWMKLCFYEGGRVYKCSLLGNQQEGNENQDLLALSKHHTTNFVNCLEPYAAPAEWEKYTP